MKIRVLRVLSIASMSIGIIMLFNAFSGFTGYSIVEDVQPARNLFAICFILVGMLTFFGEKK